MQLHEQTQRFILLLLFYLFGPLLTLGIIGGIVLRKLPSNAQSWERSFAQQTGLRWEIQSVEYRSPRFVRLHQVTIFDETAERPVFQASHIDLRLVADASREKNFPGSTPVAPTKTTGLTQWVLQAFPVLSSSDKYWQITIPFSIVDFGKYSSDESAQLVQRMLRKICSRLETFVEVPIQFVLEEIAVISEYSLQKQVNKPEDKFDLLRFVQGSVFRTPSAVRSDWSFQIKDVSEIDREHLSLTVSDTLTLAFRTGTQPISCDFASGFCAIFKHFSGGSFQGELIVSSPSGSPSHTVRLNQAVFKNVPLAPLVRTYTDVAVAGTIADLRLHQAEFSTEKMYAEGNLIVENGAIAMSLLHRCADRFQLTIKPEITLDLPIQMIPFSACAIHFRVQPEGVDFWADAKWRDAFMHYPGDNRFPAWVACFPSQQRTVTYHELMSIFVPDSAPVVPLTQGMQSIVPLLPIR